MPEVNLLEQVVKTHNCYIDETLFCFNIFQREVNKRSTSLYGFVVKLYLPIDTETAWPLHNADHLKGLEINPNRI